MADKKDAKEEPEVKQKGVVFYVAVIGLPLLIAGAAAMFFLMPMLAGEEEAKEAKAEEVKEEQRPLENALTVTGLTINPKNSLGRRLAVIELVLAVETPEILEVLKKNEPILKDRYLEYFRAKTVKELSADSLIRTEKQAIIDIANKVAGDQAAYDVFFTRFIIQ